MPDDEGQEGLLRAFLAGCDVPCPVCRYNLRGLGGPSCPECGARLDLRVGSVDLKLGAWLVSVLAVALPMGFTGILAVVGTIGAGRSAYWPLGDWIRLAALWILMVAYAGGLYAILKGRPRFLRRSAAEQWWRALALGAVMAFTQGGVLWLLFRFL